jgi:hypothetical protein
MHPGLGVDVTPPFPSFTFHGLVSPENGNIVFIKPTHNNNCIDAFVGSLDLLAESPFTVLSLGFGDEVPYPVSIYEQNGGLGSIPEAIDFDVAPGSSMASSTDSPFSYE